MRRNKEILGPLGTASFSESKTRIVGFDWSTDHPDRAAAAPDATSFVPEVRSPSASDDSSELRRGPGGGFGVATPTTPARAAPVGSIARSTGPGDDPKVDIEFAKFESVAVPAADGSLQDPSEPILRRGVTGEEWDRLLATGARLQARRRERDRNRSRKNDVVNCENEPPLWPEAGHTAGER